MPLSLLAEKASVIEPQWCHQLPCSRHRGRLYSLPILDKVTQKAWNINETLIHRIRKKKLKFAFIYNFSIYSFTKINRILTARRADKILESISTCDSERSFAFMSFENPEAFFLSSSPLFCFFWSSEATKTCNYCTNHFLPLTTWVPPNSETSTFEMTS